MEELWQRSDHDVLRDLVGSHDRMNREYGDLLALLAEALNRGLVAVNGYATGAALLRDLLRVSTGEANRLLAHAAAVTEAPSLTGAPLRAPLPATAEAVRAGAINNEHVEVIRKAIGALPDEVDPEQREQAEQTLVRAALTLDPHAVGRLGRRLQARLDQDGQPPSEAELRAPVNELRWVARRRGELELRGRLDAEGAALLTAVLGPLAKPHPDTDGERDLRSRVERQGDALVELLRRAADSGDLPSEGGERPTLQVTIPLEALTAQLGAAVLGGDTIVDARLARRLACDSAVIPVVLGSRSEPLDIGRKTRTVPTALRRTLILRDGGCAFPACTIPAPWTDAHHIHHWVDGGPTASANLVLLCRRHHRLLHHSEWQATMADGIPEFIPPAYIDPKRTPRRNPVHLNARN